MTNTDHTAEVLDSLLRGELSAIETFSHAIHKFPELGSHPILEGIRADHLQSVSLLRELIKARGGDPSTDSGVWGGVAKVVEKTASIFGDGSAVMALEHGEKHGISEYEEALEDKEVAQEVKQVIQRQLLPPLHTHLLNLRKIAA